MCYCMMMDWVHVTAKPCWQFLLGNGWSTMRDEWLSEHHYLLDSMWILLVEGEEAGQAAANMAWYFLKVVSVTNGIRDYILPMLHNICSSTYYL